VGVVRAGAEVGVQSGGKQFLVLYRDAKGRPTRTSSAAREEKAHDLAPALLDALGTERVPSGPDPQAP
jgi:hypothetical protein